MNLERTYLASPKERRHAQATLSTGRGIRPVWIKAAIFTALLIAVLAWQHWTYDRLELPGTLWPLLLVTAVLIAMVILRRVRLRTSGQPTNENHRNDQ
jgi:hypothetical protein